MALFVLLLFIAVVLGLVGAVANGLLHLLMIGVVLLAADIVFGGVRLGRGGRRPGR